MLTYSFNSGIDLASPKELIASDKDRFAIAKASKYLCRTAPGPK